MWAKACLTPEAGLQGGQEPQSRGAGLPSWSWDHAVALQGPDSPSRPPAILCLPPELPLEVLNTLRCYVRHFFGCQECAQHFEAMAAESMDQVASREEAVLWLWSHHNEVNARLAGKGGHRGRTRGSFPRGKRRQGGGASLLLDGVGKLAALGCGSGNILLSQSPITGDSWLRDTRLPQRCSWVLHAPHRELPEAATCPRRTPSPKTAPPNVPVLIPIASC